METKNDGGAAFPSRGGMMVYVPDTAREQIEEAVKALDQQHAGMTLRDYFAAQAVQAFISNSSARLGVGYEATNQSYCKAAYAIADAMIEVRAK